MFRENVDLQIFLGMVAIVAGGVVLSWQPGAAGVSTGALLVVGACVAWAIDNNLTRKVSTNDAMVIACLKGLVAGSVNLGIALLLGAHLPGVGKIAAAMMTGLAGYGISLVLLSSRCATSERLEQERTSRSHRYSALPCHSFFGRNCRPCCSGWRPH